MQVKVGIPRALLYYYYFPLWRSFFESLGAKVILSGPTNKTLLGRGLRIAADDTCLPVKLAYGHVCELAPRVDYIFLPRLVSVAKKEYICPKFLGFPDMVRQTVENLPPVLDVNIDLYRRNSLWPAFDRLGQMLGCRRWLVYRAYRRALAVQKRYEAFLRQGWLPEKAMAAVWGQNNSGPDQTAGETPAVAVIGHPYNIYDAYISMDLLRRLAASGVKPVTADWLTEETVRREAASLPKRLFWTLSQRMIGAAFHYMQDPRMAGIIHVASFACGPDSMTGELIERRIRREGKMPFLNLTLDEHTGEAGLVTRLEAFLDMVAQQERLTLPQTSSRESSTANEALPSLIPSVAGGR